MTDKRRIIAKGVPFAQISYDAIEDTTLTHAQFRVYAYLMRRANQDTWMAFPSQRRIAKEIGMDKSTVSKSLKALEVAGWIVIHVESDQTVIGHKQRHSYTVHGSRPLQLFNRTDKPTGRINQPVEPSAPTGRINQPEPTGLPVHNNTQDNTQEQQVAAKPRHDTMTEAIVDAMRWNRTDIPEAQWGRIHAAAKQLTAINADPTEMPARVAAYPKVFPGATMTPNAIATNWPALDASCDHRYGDKTAVSTVTVGLNDVRRCGKCYTTV